MCIKTITTKTSYSNFDTSLGLSSSTKMKTVNQTVQRILREGVDQLGWSDSEVARRSNQPQSTVYRLLNARTANPPFALVYEICQTLGIPLPFAHGDRVLTLPISTYIGALETKKNKSKDEDNKVEHVHITPELKDLMVCKVIDDCADRLYPKGSLLFISTTESRFLSLRLRDTVIVRISDNKAQSKIIPMTVLARSNDDEWIIHHLSNNRKKQYTYSVDKKTLEGFSENSTFKIIGVVQKALI